MRPSWREVRDATKYDRMIAFAEVLPAVRDRVEPDLALSGLPREKVLAAVVRLLDETAIRVGNQQYARENESYGLTTLRTKHLEVAGSTLRFQFRGKSGKERAVEVQDRRVAKMVRSCQELPGQEPVQYRDDGGVRRVIESKDVNDYLRQISGQEFSAKDFRTWAGTVFAARALWELGPAQSRTVARKNVTAAVRKAAARLGNTPTICRKCYVHPSVVESYLNGTLVRERGGHSTVAAELHRSGLSQDEQEVLDFLLELERDAKRHIREQARAS
jgi:DNA topoisomerase I